MHTNIPVQRKAENYFPKSVSVMTEYTTGTVGVGWDTEERKGEKGMRSQKKFGDRMSEEMPCENEIEDRGREREGEGKESEPL